MIYQNVSFGHHNSIHLGMLGGEKVAVPPFFVLQPAENNFTFSCYNCPNSNDGDNLMAPMESTLTRCVAHMTFRWTETLYRA